jgi:hypothetical protein
MSTSIERSHNLPCSVSRHDERCIGLHNIFLATGSEVQRLSVRDCGEEEESAKRRGLPAQLFDAER